SPEKPTQGARIVRLRGGDGGPGDRPTGALGKSDSPTLRCGSGDPGLLLHKTRLTEPAQLALRSCWENRKSSRENNS
ncbi:unnamed protein product, partial [Gulo gulo]